MATIKSQLFFSRKLLNKRVCIFVQAVCFSVEIYIKKFCIWEYVFCIFTKYETDICQVLFVKKMFLLLEEKKAEDLHRRFQKWNWTSRQGKIQASKKFDKTYYPKPLQRSRHNNANFEFWRLGNETDKIVFRLYFFAGRKKNLKTSLKCTATCFKYYNDTIVRFEMKDVFFFKKGYYITSIGYDIKTILIKSVNVNSLCIST